MPAARPAPVAAEHAPRARPAPPTTELRLVHDEASVRSLVGAPPPPDGARYREPLVPRATTRAMVLLYHSFNRGDTELSVRERDFEAELDWLDRHHVEIVRLSELVEFLEGSRSLPARVAVITIDDAYQSVYQIAWPVLHRHGTRFTLGIPTAMLEHPGHAPVMTWSEVREMTDSGLCEVASHGHMHRSLSTLSGRPLEDELTLSRDLIAEHTGTPPIAFFYPLGAYSPVAVKAVKRAGYRAAFRASGAPIAVGSGSRYWLPRMTIGHDDSEYTVARYFSEGFLGRVAYIAARDPQKKH
jgi:peptidoglycan/xylan/chitin deacetylase (PgdA/CDA1 family)